MLVLVCSTSEESYHNAASCDNEIRGSFSHELGQKCFRGRYVHHIIHE